MKTIRAIVYEREKQFGPGLYRILGLELWECAAAALGAVDGGGAFCVRPDTAPARDISGLLEALNASGEDGVLLLPDDKCAVSKQTLENLCSAYAQNGVFAAVPAGDICVFSHAEAAALTGKRGGFADISDFTAALKNTLRGQTVPCARAEDELTANTLPSLARAARALRLSANEYHMERGVMLVDPENTYISPGARIGAGSVIYPGVYLEGRTQIGAGCVIGPNCRIADSSVGDYAEITFSVLKESSVGARAAVGPFAYMRPNSHVGERCKIGDFVEIKNSVIGDGTKVPHLTYVGDSDVGGGVNFGCGSVTVNYDGVKKRRTTVGDNAFIGCNTNLVAPVTVGAGAYTAAGSTITRDVPPGALAVARERQTNKEGWVEKSGLKKPQS